MRRGDEEEGREKKNIHIYIIILLYLCIYGPCERVSLWVKIEEANLIIVINVRKDGGKGKGE